MALGIMIAQMYRVRDTTQFAVSRCAVSETRRANPATQAAMAVEHCLRGLLMNVNTL